MFPRTDDLLRALPELMWCGFGMLAMLLQPFVRSRHFFTVLALLGAVGGTAAAFVAGATPGEGFYGLIESDVFSFFFRLLIGLVAVLVVLAADSYRTREPAVRGILCTAAVCYGGHGRFGFREGIVDGFHRTRAEFYFQLHTRRVPTGLHEIQRSIAKILSAGIFRHGIFLYGIALVYGATGTTNPGRMDDADPGSNLLKLGLSLILIGIGFKVAAAPFQIWTRTYTKERPHR